MNMWNILFILISCLYLIDCCRFGPDPNCGVPCRCTGENKCDSDTGECVPGSQCQKTVPTYFTRRGPGCITGNVAFKKSNVKQSGQWSIYKAELAVDGDVNPYITSNTGDSCAHPFTQEGTYAWWWVDLGELYIIKAIGIVNRLRYLKQPSHNGRSTDYDIKIGNTSDRSDQILCFNQNKAPDNVQPLENFQCIDGDMVGRYVSFSRTGGVDPNQATICEFIVMGSLVIECDKFHCKGNCDTAIGCDECATGKMLPDCTQDCPEGYWGINCAITCGMCKDGVVCDAVTGSCGEQCEGWHIPELCTKELGEPLDIVKLEATNVTSDSALLTWNSANIVDNDMKQYFFFTVRHSKYLPKLNDWELSNDIAVSNTNGDSFQYLIQDLDYNSLYKVQILSFRKLNSMTEEGNIYTTQFETTCKAPTQLTKPVFEGTIDGFTVSWEALQSSGCDSVRNLSISLDCHNASHMIDVTFRLFVKATTFQYQTHNAVICFVKLTVINNAGISSTSPTSSIIQQCDLGKSICTKECQDLHVGVIAAGAVGGLICLILVVVIVVMALRLHSVKKNVMYGQESTIGGNHNKTATYANTQTFDDVTDINPSGLEPGSDYMTVDDGLAQGKSLQNYEGGQPFRKNSTEQPNLYENTTTEDKTSYDQINKGIADKTVYQELK